MDSLLITHERNAGLCKTLNQALSHARGKYVSMVATDDEWLPNKLETQVAQMEESSEDVGVLYGDAYQIDEEGRVLPEKFFASHREGASLPEGDVFGALLEGNFIPAMATLVRKECYDRVGGFDERLCYEDWDMWLRVAQHYRFAVSPVVATRYRIVSTSLTRMVLYSQTSVSFTSDYLILAKCLDAPRLTEAQENVVRKKLITLCRANLMKQELIAELPRGALFILVDGNTLGGLGVGDRTAVPFIERNGQYWGAPANDAAAIQELERLRGEGATFMAFVETSFWWFEYYSAFKTYLETHFRCRVRTDRLVIFELTAA